MFGHRFRPRSALAALLVGGALGVGLAGCGGSSSAPIKTRKTRVSTSTAGHPASGGPAVTTGPVKAVLHGPDHDPVANKNWTYTVHVADAHGRPLSGTLLTEFTFQGAVVGRDTPPTHTFSHGHFREKLKFPVAAVGYPVDLQVVVRTAAGSVTLDWPVAVRR